MVPDAKLHLFCCNRKRRKPATAPGQLRKTPCPILSTLFAERVGKHNTPIQKGAQSLCFFALLSTNSTTFAARRSRAAALS
jgi:hypothetical protein